MTCRTRLATVVQNVSRFGLLWLFRTLFKTTWTGESIEVARDPGIIQSSLNRFGPDRSPSNLDPALSLIPRSLTNGAGFYLSVFGRSLIVPADSRALTTVSRSRFVRRK